MITIKTMSNISCVKEERRLPIKLIEFLEETFKELHESYDPEVDINHFSLEMHGPIYVLEKGLHNLVDLGKVGLFPEKNRIMGYPPEWVEILDFTDCRFWRIGAMGDNGYLFQVLLQLDAFGRVVDQWLKDSLDEDEMLARLYTGSNDKAE